jgi:hypothetical protein
LLRISCEVTATYARAAEPDTPSSALLQQLKTQEKEESGIMIANIEELFPRRKRHKIVVLEEIAETGGIIMPALTESHLREDIHKIAKTHIIFAHTFR